MRSEDVDGPRLKDGDGFLRTAGLDDGEDTAVENFVRLPHETGDVCREDA
jgi:hypothetical protein